MSWNPVGKKSWEEVEKLGLTFGEEIPLFWMRTKKFPYPTHSPLHQLSPPPSPTPIPTPTSPHPTALHPLPHPLTPPPPPPHNNATHRPLCVPHINYTYGTHSLNFVQHQRLPKHFRILISIIWSSSSSLSACTIPSSLMVPQNV